MIKKFLVEECGPALGHALDKIARPAERLLNNLKQKVAAYPVAQKALDGAERGAKIGAMGGAFIYGGAGLVGTPVVTGLAVAKAAAFLWPDITPLHVAGFFIGSAAGLELAVGTAFVSGAAGAMATAAAGATICSTAEAVKEGYRLGADKVRAWRNGGPKGP